MAKREIIENPSKAQIKQWEESYSQLKVITLDREVEIDEETKKEVVINEGVTGYFRKPDRATVKFANTKLTKADGSIDPISPGEVIFNSCFLGGDLKMKSEDKYFFRACMELNGWLNDIMGFTSSS